MKPDKIIANQSYTNKSGRSERRVLDIGMHIKPRWFGAEGCEPKGEPGVRFIDTRLGMTFYGRGSGKREQTLFLSSFANWAHYAVADCDAAPHK